MAVSTVVWAIAAILAVACVSLNSKFFHKMSVENGFEETLYSLKFFVFTIFSVYVCFSSFYTGVNVGIDEGQTALLEKNKLWCYTNLKGEQVKLDKPISIEEYKIIIKNDTEDWVTNMESRLDMVKKIEEVHDINTHRTILKTK